MAEARDDCGYAFGDLDDAKRWQNIIASQKAETERRTILEAGGDKANSLRQQLAADYEGRRRAEPHAVGLRAAIEFLGAVHEIARKQDKSPLAESIVGLKRELDFFVQVDKATPAELASSGVSGTRWEITQNAIKTHIPLDAYGDDFEGPYRNIKQAAIATAKVAFDKAAERQRTGRRY